MPTLAKKLYWLQQAQNINRRRSCEGGASFDKRGPESEWNLQRKLASGPIAVCTVVIWPSLSLKIASFAISSRTFLNNYMLSTRTTILLEPFFESLNVAFIVSSIPSIVYVRLPFFVLYKTRIGKRNFLLIV